MDILLVEDNPDFAQLVSESLRATGATVVLTTSAATAKFYLAQRT